MTLQEFIDETGIVLTSRKVVTNPHMEGSDSMDNYHVKLRAKSLGNATMRLYYSKGKGLNGVAPTADEVLDCLASDASSIENANNNFEAFCDDYGYDIDSRKAEKTFNACARQAQRLNKFLGEDYYRQLLWDVERS